MTSRKGLMTQYCRNNKFFIFWDVVRQSAITLSRSLTLFWDVRFNSAAILTSVTFSGLRPVSLSKTAALELDVCLRLHSLPFWLQRRAHCPSRSTSWPNVRILTMTFYRPTSPIGQPNLVILLTSYLLSNRFETVYCCTGGQGTGRSQCAHRTPPGIVSRSFFTAQRWLAVCSAYCLRSTVHDDDVAAAV